MVLIKAFDEIRVPADPAAPLGLATKQYADTKLGRPTITSTKTANYTASAGELVMVDATSGPITVTLPAAVLGARVTVKKLDTSTNVVTILAAGTDTIGSAAAATVPVRLQDQATTLQAAASSPSANWVVPHNHVSPSSLDARYLPKLVATATKTAAYTAAAGDLVVADDSGSSFTVTLPAATSGAIVGIRRVSAGANVVTVARAGTDTIGAAGLTSITLILQDQVTVLQAVGTVWVPLFNMLSLPALDTRYARAFAPVSLTDGATITIDAATGTTFRASIAGDRTFAAPTNPVDGQQIIIEVTASGAGRTPTFATGSAGAFVFSTDLPATVIGTIASGTTTVVGAKYHATAQRWRVMSVHRGF